MKKKLVAMVMVAGLMAGPAWGRDDRDGRDWAYGADDYSINRNKEAEQNRKHERAMEDQRQQMQREQRNQQQQMQREFDSQMQNRNLLGR